MRLVNVGVWVAAVSAAFAIFAGASSPRDELPGLKPYIQSDFKSYYREATPTGSRIVFSRSIRFKKRMPISDIKALLLGAPHGSKIAFQNREYVLMFPWQPKGPRDGTCDTITYTKTVKWNEALWVKLGDLGGDPFPADPWALQGYEGDFDHPQNMLLAPTR